MLLEPLIIRGCKVIKASLKNAKWYYYFWKTGFEGVELYYLLFIIAALVYQLLNFKAVSASYSYRNEVICIDGFETNKKPGNQFQNKSLKAIQAILEYIWSSLFNASSPIKVYPWKKIIDQKITPTLLRKSKHFFCWWPSIISFKMWTSNLDTVRLVFWVISTPNEMTPLTHYTQVPDL